MAIINLNQSTPTISRSTGEANLSSGDVTVGNALRGFGENALGIATKLAVKDRENDVKQSSWDAFSNFDTNLTKELLAAKARTDTNGKIADLNPDGTWKKDSEGNTVYKLDEDNQPLSYVSHVTSSINTLRNGMKERFSEDEDKFNYFDDLSRQTVNQTLVKSIISQNEMINNNIQSTFKNRFHNSLSKGIIYDQPDFYSVIDTEVKKDEKYLDDTYQQVDPEKYVAIKQEMLKETGTLLSEKMLLFAEIDPQNAGQSITDYVGMHLVFDPSINKFMAGFVKDRYDETAANEILRQYARNVVGLIGNKLPAINEAVSKATGKPSRLEMKEMEGIINSVRVDNPSIALDMIDIEGDYTKAEKEAISNVVKSELLKSNRYFQAQDPKKQHKDIRDLLMLKWEQDKNKVGNFKGQVDELVAFAGRREGRGQFNYISDQLGMLYKTPMWEKTYNTFETVEKGFKVFENHVEDFIADNVYQTQGKLTDLNGVAKSQVKNAKQFIADFSHNDPKVLEWLERKEVGSTIVAPLEQKLTKMATTLVSEYNENPNKFLQKHGYNKGMMALEKKAYEGDLTSSQELKRRHNEFQRQQGSVVYDQYAFVPDTTVGRFKSDVGGALNAGDFIGAAKALRKSNLYSKDYGMQLLIKSETGEDKVQAPVLGALAVSMMGGPGESEGTSALATNLMRVNPKTIQDVNRTFPTLYENADKLKKEEIKINGAIHSALSETMPSIFYTGKDSNSAKMGGYVSDYVRHEVKARLIEKPDSDVDDLVEEIVKDKIASKVTDYSKQPGWTTHSDAYVAIRGVFKKSDRTHSDVKEKAVNEFENFNRGLREKQYAIDTTKMPLAFHEFLSSVGKDKASQTDKERELMRRFQFVIHSRSVTGDDTTGELMISDGKMTTGVYIKDQKGSSRVYTIKGFAD